MKIYRAFMVLSKIASNLYIKVNDDQYIPISEYFWMDSIAELNNEEGMLIELPKEE